MSHPTIYDPDDDSFGRRSPPLQIFEPHLGPESPPELPPARERAPRKESRGWRARDLCADPGSVILIRNFAPNNPELSRVDLAWHDASSDSDSDDSMVEIAAEPAEPGIGNVERANDDATAPPKSEPAQPSSFAKADASAIANAALAHQTTSEAQEGTIEVPSKSLGVSRHDEGLQLRQQKQEHLTRMPGLLVKTEHQESNATADDTIATSPRLGRHVIPEAAGTLPAMQSTSPTKDGPAMSPQAEKLPSVHQMMMGDPLIKLAEAATQQDTRVPSRTHHHSQSLGSATSPSPMLPSHSYPMGQTSPSNHYIMAARSPASAISDPFHGSPTHAHPPYFIPRRSSTATASTPNFPASLPSASSSNDSHGAATSSVDGYTPSTSHTTPIETASVPDAAPARTLPPPPGSQVPNGYKCDYPGCPASPFQTQYLLSSHKNVHSSTRSHFCPIEGCPHGENGKGFKRKNEMKRHALVHKSPYYTCPFCPDQKHKYPRPDNLQRHVRVHHTDKSRDDPELRDVLSQRSDGTGKVARRRRNTSSSV